MTDFLNKTFEFIDLIRKEYHGENYKDPKDFYSETEKTFSGNPALDPSKYTEEMLAMFKAKCKSENSMCMNASCDWCYLKNKGCFNTLFNGIPDGLIGFCIDKGMKKDKIKNYVKTYLENHEITDQTRMF